MIRPVSLFLIAFALWCGWLTPSASAAEKYTLIQGDPIEGDPMVQTITQTGLIFKRPDGTLTERVLWSNLTQSSLKQVITAISKDRNVPASVRTRLEALLEPDEPDQAAKERMADDIKPKKTPRLERPDSKAGFGALFTSSIMVTAFILLYLANVYAGYEVGIFRNYHPAIVSGAAAVLPVIGPVIFLCLPTRIPKESLIPKESPMEHYVVPEIPIGASDEEVAAAVVAANTDASGLPKTIVYQRGEYVFNRRFFETKLAPFLRVVPGDAEKDLLVFVRSARGEYLAPRITKATPEEVVLQVRKGEATADVPIPYIEISEVQVRHKDAA